MGPSRDLHAPTPCHLGACRFAIFIRWADSGPPLTGAYHHAAGIVPPADTTANTGQVLSDMLASELWSFGLPFAETAKDGDVLVAYYSGSKGCMDINIARLRVCR